MLRKFLEDTSIFRVCNCCASVRLLLIVQHVTRIHQSAVGKRTPLHTIHSPAWVYTIYITEVTQIVAS